MTKNKQNSKKKAKKTAKKKAKTGRPTMLDETLKRIALNLYKTGKTDKEVADIVGVSEASINNYKKNDPDFFESIKEAKKLPNEKVKIALYERALGYTHPEVIHKVVSMGGNMGSQVESIDTVKHYPPETKAAIFWLKNRDPENWRDKQEVALSGSLDMEKLTDEELERRYKEAQEAMEKK